MDIISTKLKLYVQNKAYYKALKILDENNCCIISGIPGIGKTTLAEMLLITYLDKDYEVVKITQNINEAFNVYSSGKKQIFLYDDFLGQTGLELKLAKNEDQDILNFIRYVEKSRSSKFVLTTREYILNQAKNTYESLLRSNIDLKKCTLLLSDYTKHDKAKILFNHLYYQKLPIPYIENLLDNNVLTIVNHKNYNPRIIEIMTHNMLPQNPDEFYESFIMNLDNPNYIWKLAFENHISNEARDLLILLTSLPLKSEIENVETVFNYYHSEKCKMYNRDFSDRDFRNALKELDGSFIQIDQNMISFHNPSINDFLKSTILENDFEFKTLCETAVCFQQCIYLFNIARQTDYRMVDKYKDSFSAAVLENLLLFNIKFMYGNSINITGKYDYYNSVINRVILVIKINDIIKSKSISDYLKDEFFPNLSTNFEYYGGAISEYRELIKLSEDSKYQDYFDIYLIKAIRDYVIEMILSNYAEEIEDFKFILELEDIYPNLIDDYNKNQVSEMFSNFYHGDVNSVVDWGEVEAIDDYISTLEMLGKYFDVEVNDMVAYLECEKEEIPTFDEDSAYEEYRDNFIGEKFDDQMINDMFDALLSQ